MVSHCKIFYINYVFLHLSYNSSIAFLQFVDENLSVMSVGFLLASLDDAVIWRGPKKNGIFLY